MLLRPRAARLALLASSVIALAIIAPTSALADSGGLDTTFTRVTLPANTTFTKTLKLADGSTVAVGSSGTSTKLALVAKFSPSGALDASFGTGGVVTFDVPAGTEDTLLSVEQRANGGFVVGGGGTDVALPGVYNSFISKLTATGALDTTWSATGSAVPAGFLQVDDVFTVHELANGDVEFAGVNDNGASYVVAQIDGTGSSVNVPQGIASRASADGIIATFAGSVRRPDGSFTFVGGGENPAGDREVSVTTYAENGIVNTTYTTLPSDARVVSATAASTGALFVVGAVGNRGAIWRFTAADTLDTTFGAAGRLDLAPATEPWTATSIAA
ncbi:MAG: hypothetical protein JWN72_1958, partial [Thermoleophilia bacterium]|nr:hypothetical protein [Thermoleophilia bacterium]